GLPSPTTSHWLVSSGADFLKRPMIQYYYSAVSSAGASSAAGAATSSVVSGSAATVGTTTETMRVSPSAMRVTPSGRGNSLAYTWLMASRPSTLASMRSGMEMAGASIRSVWASCSSVVPGADSPTTC